MSKIREILNDFQENNSNFSTIIIELCNECYRVDRG